MLYKTDNGELVNLNKIEYVTQEFIWFQSGRYLKISIGEYGAILKLID